MAETRTEGKSQNAALESESKIDDLKKSDIPTADGGQGEKENGEDKNPDEPSPKKARISKDITMVETAKLAKDFIGKEKLDESRSMSRAIRESKSAASKRLSTMAKTAKEGEALLKELGYAEENATERRRTRSQTRGTPPVSSASTPKSAQKDTLSKRSRRGRPKKDDKEEEDSKDDDEGDEEEQEKNEKVNNSSRNTQKEEEEEEDEEEEGDEEEDDSQDGEAKTESSADTSKERKSNQLTTENDTAASQN